MISSGCCASTSSSTGSGRGTVRQRQIHHLLAGTYREQRASLTLPKYLANDLQISMVLVGTRDAVLTLQTGAQMLSRYTPFEIPR
ncbi:TniB family NTP-binding protein [Caballeronia sp. LjRoot31]|uniref:TniB family NTP-binding protein n=1 Tax=Caballeronia sp. LjRoot31 TaxID=3342324 RepID=UPI003F4FE224